MTLPLDTEKVSALLCEVYERRLRAHIEQLRSLEVEDGGELEATIADLEEHADAVIHHEVSALGKALVGASASVTLPTTNDVLFDGLELSERNAAIAEAIAELWPWTWEADGQARLSNTFAETSPWPGDTEPGVDVPLLTRIVREFYWRSSLPVFEAYRTWTFVGSVADGAAFKFLRDAAQTAIGEQATGVQLDALATAVMQHVRAMRVELGMNEPPPATNNAATARAVTLNTEFTASLARVGKKGSELAGQFRELLTSAAYQEDPWLLWRFTDGSAPFLVPLGRALWVDVVEAELKRRARNHEALAMPIHTEVTRMYSRAGVPNKDSRQLVFDDGFAISFDNPLLDAAGLELVYRGIGLLGSVDAHRLLQWQVRSGYEQWINGSPNPHVLDVERGYGELAERLQVRDKGAAQRLRAILNAQKTCNFPIPGTTRAWANLIILWEWEGSGRRPGRIRIELGSMLMPTFIHELKGELKGRNLATVQRLVPLVGLPPFVGHERSHGAQATLAMLITREMRVRAPELYQRGGIQMDLPRWARLAEEARIPRSEVGQRLGTILSRWTRDGDKKRDGDDAPAFLKKEGRLGFTLGDRYEPARRFLMEAGQREAEGAKGGKLSVQQRRAKLRRRIGPK